MDSQKDADKQIEPIVSPSLLPNEWEMNDVEEFYDKRFDFMQDPEWLPPPEAKRKKLSSSLNKERRKIEDRALVDSTNIVDSTIPTAESSRFGLLTSEEELQTAAKGVVPSNTICNTRWAENNFRAWAVERNKSCPQDPVPLELFKSHDAKLVCKNLCRFVMETRREDGKPYPPASLRCLLSAFNRILQDNKAPFSVFDKKDPQFRDLLRTLDTVSSELHREGIGAQHKSAAVISYEDENVLWEKGLLGDDSPRKLQHTIFYYAGMQFCLRGIQEQYDMRVRQLIRVPTDSQTYHEQVYYKYVEFISKNNQHRFKDTNASNKEVKVYAIPGSSRCMVRLLDKYLERLPPDAEYMYMRPLDKTNLKQTWYTKQRVGYNTLKGFIPKLFATSGLEGLYTNHSLRATSITRMFKADVPEKIIAEKSGHKSLKALRMYERTSSLQEQATGVAIMTGEQFSSGHNDVELSELIEKSDKKPDVDANAQGGQSSKSEISPLQLPTFSGKLENCTININFNQQ